MEDRVKIAVRVRPPNERETGMGNELGRCIISMEGNQTTITNPLAFDEDGTVEDRAVWASTFAFDHSYWSVAAADDHYQSQENVYEDLGAFILENAWEGFNCSIFAYGQTGSGKSYTMMGVGSTLASPREHWGLIPRICYGLFDNIARASEQLGDAVQYKVDVSYLEIYNEAVRDLFRPRGETAAAAAAAEDAVAFSRRGSGGSQGGAGAASAALRVRSHPKTGVYVEGLTRLAVSCYEDIETLLDEGGRARTMAVTKMNQQSSRSHAIFTVLFQQTRADAGRQTDTQSKICLVDLAGSERAEQSGAVGQRLREASEINKSLSVLGDVIQALASAKTGTRGGAGAGRQEHVPYRNSVLTWLLKESLGGNAKTVMVATLSPCAAYYDESLSTLKYIDRAKSITCSVKVNEEPHEKLIRELRAEAARYEALYKKMLEQNDGAVGGGAEVEETAERRDQVKRLLEMETRPADEREEQTQRVLRQAGLRVQGDDFDPMLPQLTRLNHDLFFSGAITYALAEGEWTCGTGDAAERYIELGGDGILEAEIHA